MLPSQGAAVGFKLYSSFNTTVRAAHFVFIPFVPPSSQEIAGNNITLSDAQKVAEQRYIELTTIGMGYFIEQTTKVWRDIPSISLGYLHSTYSPMILGWLCTTTQSGSLHGWAQHLSIVRILYILLKQLTPRNQ
jgi:hypothetical protein